MYQKNTKRIIIIALMSILYFLPLAASAEVVYPVPSYENEALAKDGTG